MEKIPNLIGSIIVPSMLLLCTIVYTWINHKMLKESKATRLQKLTPQIIAYLERTEIHGSRTIILSIKNIGEGVAKNVTTNIHTDFEWVEGLPLCERGIFKNGIEIFPPQYKLQYPILSFDENKTEDLNKSIIFNINYYTSLDKKISDRFELSFKSLSGLVCTTPPNDYKNAMVYYLKEICLNLKDKK